MSKDNQNNNTSDVAIVFDDLTEFYVMRAAIDDLKKQGVSVDVIVPHDSGYNGLFEHTYAKIKELGYDPKKDAPKNRSYKVLLTPYPILDVVDRIKYVYHLRYSYGALSAKPKPTYSPNWKVPYDGVFSFNAYEEFIEAYGVKCYALPYWRYQNFKKEKTTSDKPTLLMLPTFGPDVSCIHLFDKTLIKDLKENYHVISKAHHATHFNADNDNSFEILKSLSDEFYDSDTSLETLLQKADIVLSDNSGAIFEALYVDIPVALFAKNLNVRKLGNIDTLQYRLASQGILPHTDNPRRVLPMLKNLGAYKNKQAAIRKQLFLEMPKNPTSVFTKIVKEYLASDPSEDYRKAVHDLLINDIKQDQALIADLRNQLRESEQRVMTLEQRASEQDTIIRDIYNSTSWRITKPMRKVKQIGKNISRKIQ